MPDPRVVKFVAAGSLEGALTDLAEAWKAQGGMETEGRYGPSGLWRERIEHGLRPDLFFSADRGHPETLATENLADSPVVFAGNAMCLYGCGLEGRTPDDVMDLMLDPGVRLAMSTPQIDPSGDYAVEIFRRIDRLRPGSFDRLIKKARSLVGSRDHVRLPGRHAVTVLFEQGELDVFLGYRTSARTVMNQMSGVSVLDLPESLALKTTCCAAVIAGAGPGSREFLSFIMTPSGQEILARRGFATAAETA